ncbi:MAG TPA: hypothetical protein VM368_04985, partial [Flavisolibacter sp.]|nr:hypothetical protein [Flavisolibacter sp.]
MTGEIPKALDLEQKVFAIHNEEGFHEIALELFIYQYFNNPVYKAFCNALKRNPEAVNSINQIPFIPISFFKSHAIKTAEFEPQVIFKSSGTTGAVTSYHHVKSTDLYITSFLRCFETVFGPVDQYCILGLLPSYLEQGNSSLVFMVDHLIKESKHELSGFYLTDFQHLSETLQKLEEDEQPAILFGVTYALLDFAENFSFPLRNTIIIETGGMKGRKKEITKEGLYEELMQSFGLSAIHGEYGMTELLSQAYAVNGLYTTPPWMKVLLRDETDPFTYSSKSGALNVIDLANIYSCSFIATDDLGRWNENGKFEVLGRIDNS